jgi:hypothetical protein
MALVLSAIAVLAITTLWSIYQQWRITDYTILVGPGGGMLEDDARRIKTKVENNSSPIGAAYRVSVQPTEGFEEIRRRINADETGRLIGFSHDGFGNAENVRILLPLDKNYLYILCRRDFLKESLSDPPPKSPTFADVAPKLRPGRCALGPPNSGTRRLSELVMDNHDLSADKFHAHGIANWYDMRAALNNESIDLAFYGGRLDADIVQAIANDGNCVMLGLDDERDALVQGRPYLFKEQFEKNSFVAGDFCPAPMHTISSRSLLMCSSAMSDSTAYFLARNSQDAIRTSVPEIIWDNPPAEAPRAGKLTYQIHPGAERLRNNSPLGSLPWNWNYVWMTIGLWVAVEAVQAANGWFRKHPAEPLDAAGESTAPQTPASQDVRSQPAPATAAAPDPLIKEAASRDAYDALHHELHEDLWSLTIAPQLTKTQRTAWLEKVKQRRDRIKTMESDGQLLEKHSAALLAAVDKLAIAVESRNGKPQKAPLSS